MSIKVKSNSFMGVQSSLIEVEVDIGRGLPGFYIIGLGDAAVLESRERVKTALKNYGITISDKKIIVNLSPASQRKEGTNYDLAIAVGVLIGMKELEDNENILEKYIFIGELTLDGRVNGVKGGIGSAILAKELGYKGVVLPYDNLNEANLIPDINNVGVKDLEDLKIFFQDPKKYILEVNKKDKIDLENKIDFANNNLRKEEEIINKIYLTSESPEKTCEIEFQEMESIDFSDVRGQKLAKRAMEIAIAGGHNILMIGSPGSGKSMIAKRVTTIMPEMEIDEVIECTKIYSISGELKEKESIISRRPFRAPHHTATLASIIGGGRNVRAGEITLSHNGVLFLDELSEFPKEVLESLRQPLEEGRVFISRLGYKVELPCNMILVAASNPCNCGLLYEGDGQKCKCSPHEISRYNKKISGPILDRMDLAVKITKLKEDELFNQEKEESSHSIKERVIAARGVQKARFKGKKYKLNGRMSQKDLEKHCLLSEELESYMKFIVNKLELSPRAYHKVLKVSRTIADLEGKNNIAKHHILEALNYRKS